MEKTSPRSIMVKQNKYRHEVISNLSLDLIETAFLLLCEYALPAYKQKINLPRPPIDSKENSTSVSAIVTLLAGLDFHLCWLKYSKDALKPITTPPSSPFFSWNIDDYLVDKVTKLLPRRTERSLLSQVLEITACRDAIIHPKFYTISHIFDAESNMKRMVDRLVPGIKLRPKMVNAKMKNKNLTKKLKIPLVPTWISYADAVIAVFVVYRFLMILEARHGRSYISSAQLSRYARRAKHLFGDLEWPKDYQGTFLDWLSAFYGSLSPSDRVRVDKTQGAMHLRGNLVQS